MAGGGQGGGAFSGGQGGYGGGMRGFGGMGGLSGMQRFRGATPQPGNFFAARPRGRSEPVPTSVPDTSAVMSMPRRGGLSGAPGGMGQNKMLELPPDVGMGGMGGMRGMRGMAGMAGMGGYKSAIGSPDGDQVAQAQVVPPGAIGGDLGNPIYAGTPEGDAFMRRQDFSRQSGMGDMGGMNKRMDVGMGERMGQSFSSPLMPSPLPQMQNPFSNAGPGIAVGAPASFAPPPSPAGGMDFSQMNSIGPMGGMTPPSAPTLAPPSAPDMGMGSIDTGMGSIDTGMGSIDTGMGSIDTDMSKSGLPFIPNTGVMGQPGQYAAPNPGNDPRFAPLQQPAPTSAQSAYDLALQNYNSPEYAAHYNSLAPSTRAFMHAPGNQQMGQYLAGQARDNYTAFQGRDPFRRATGGIVSLLNRR